MNIFQKLLFGWIGFFSVTNSYAAEVIWLSDNSGWDRSAAALRERGFDVKNVNLIGKHSGLVIRVQGALNDLTTARGTPFGGYAVAVQVMYRCTIGSISLELNPNAKIANYSFTGQTASQEMPDIISSHVNAVLTTYQEADVNLLAKSCEDLRQMAANEKGTAKSSSKRKS